MNSESPSAQGSSPAGLAEMTDLGLAASLRKKKKEVILSLLVLFSLPSYIGGGTQADWTLWTNANIFAPWRLTGIRNTYLICDILPFQIVPCTLIVGSLLDLDQTIPYTEERSISLTRATENLMLHILKQEQCLDYKKKLVIHTACSYDISFVSKSFRLWGKVLTESLSPLWLDQRSL